MVDSIEEKDLFAKFLENENLIDKIKEMFVYILEEYTSYPLEMVQKRYCGLPIDYDYYDYDEEEDETREEKSNREVRAKVKAYLIKIVEKRFVF